MRAENVALIPNCASVAPEERWRAYLGGDDLDEPAELARFMGTSAEQIDKTYGHLLPDALDRTQLAFLSDEVSLEQRQ